MKRAVAIACAALLSGCTAGMIGAAPGPGADETPDDEDRRDDTDGDDELLDDDGIDDPIDEPPSTTVEVSDPVSVVLPGGIGSVRLSAPPQVDSFITLIEGPGGVLFGPTRIVDPSGQTVVDWEELFPTTPASQNFRFDLTCTSIPLSDELLPVAGEYDVLINTDSYEDVEVTIQTIARVGSDMDALRADGRTLSLDVVHHLVSLDDLPAGERDPDFAAAVSELERLVSQAGIRVTSVRFEQMDAPALSSIDTFDPPNNELGQLLSHSPDGRELHLYWVEQIASDDDLATLGIAGAVGGPATLGGRVASGVAISILDLAYDPRFVGSTAAHEVLHFLGLFHTTEACAAVTDECPVADSDPLDDTAECPGGNDRDDDGILTVQECADRDGHNLMFWGGDPASPNELTAAQAAIVRRNPLVY
jgi:hypothetical protein